MARPVVTIKAGREKPLRRHHPWVFSGAIQRADRAEAGAEVDVRAADGSFLGRGLFNEASQIQVRLFTFDEREKLDDAFFARRLREALARRAPLLARPGQTAARLVMSEADRLPGLIVDRYGDAVVVQALTAGMDKRIDLVAEVLDKELAPRVIVERSDDAVRELEGLERRQRVLRGDAAEPVHARFEENGLKFGVDLTSGHKTGYYLDQRENHARVGALAEGRRVLDAFCYTGGFSAHAAAKGAREIVGLDQSEGALARMQENLAANGLGPARTIEGDAFQELRKLRDAGEKFGLVVLDPPKFALSAAQVDQAARGYKDINLLGFKLTEPGGYVATFSCSGHISADLFQKTVFGAAADAGVEAQIVGYLAQADDHPVLLSFPESLYLKGLLCRVIG